MKHCRNYIFCYIKGRGEREGRKGGGGERERNGEFLDMEERLEIIEFLYFIDEKTKIQRCSGVLGWLSCWRVQLLILRLWV